MENTFNAIVDLSNILYKVNVEGVEVTFYPYSTAVLEEVFFSFRVDPTQQLEFTNSLAKAASLEYDRDLGELKKVAGSHTDNKVIYRVGDMAYWYKDGEFRVGLAKSIKTLKY